MKKIIIVVLLLFLFAGCNEPKYDYTSALEFKEIKINNDNNSIDFIINVNNIEYDAISYGILIKFGTVLNVDEMDITNSIYKEEEELTNNLYTLSYIDDFSSFYKDKINIRTYYKYLVKDKEEILYSNDYHTYSLYDLSLLSNGNLSNKIIEENRKILINEVSFNLNTTTYEVTSTSSNYTTELIPDKNYNYITVVITLNEYVKLTNDFKVIVNGKTVDFKYIKVEDNKITYKIDDPNWTKIY